MHAVTLISRALGPDEVEAPPAPIADGLCCVTGEYGPSVPRDLLLGPSFTTWDLLAAPGSERVGIDAWRALRYGWERKSSWICDGRRFVRLDRRGVREAVLAQTMPEIWAAYATTSYQKHGALRAPVNRGARRVWLWESEFVDCSDRTLLADTWGRLNEALRAGFQRVALESLECPLSAVRGGRLHQWLAFERWARPRCRSALYRFLCYLLPSRDELALENR